MKTQLRTSPDPFNPKIRADHAEQTRSANASHSRLDRISNWPDLARNTGYSPFKLATFCRISSSQLRRYFVKRFGTSPQRWLKELRLDQTAQLLKTSTASLKEIAALLDFSSQSLLCHQFKIRFGCKPSAFASTDRPLSCLSRRKK